MNKLVSTDKVFLVLFFNVLLTALLALFFRVHNIGHFFGLCAMFVFVSAVGVVILCATTNLDTKKEDLKVLLTLFNYINITPILMCVVFIRNFLVENKNIEDILFGFYFLISYFLFAYFVEKVRVVLKEETAEVNVEKTIQGILDKTNQEIFLLKTQLIDLKRESLSDDVLALEKVIEELIVKNDEYKRVLALQNIEIKTNQLKQDVLAAQQSLETLNSLTLTK